VKARIRRAALLSLALLVGGLAACAEPNPIEGVWVVDEEASSGGAQAAASVAGLKQLEFREDKLVIGTESVDVSYETDGQRVIVTRTAEGKGEVYTMTDDGKMKHEMPMGITVVYKRAEATPPVAAEAGEKP
jgi:hypothetical protein